MPSPCVVPHCNSNYRNGPTHKVYSFPKNPQQKNRWISSIKRENFSPTIYSKVCELHFKDEDFITTSKAVDEKTGHIIEVPLKVKRLHPDAVPSQFPSLPGYFTKSISRRQSPDSKKAKTEQHLISQALEESLASKSTYDEKRTFYNLSKLQQCAHLIDKKWTMIQTNCEILLIQLNPHPVPKVQKAIVFDESLKVKVFNEDLEITKLGKFSFPCFINNINDLNEILKDLHTLNTKNLDLQNPIVNSIINALNSLENSGVNKGMLTFLIEQFSFLFCNKHGFRYSTDTLIFTTLLYTISPQAYRFVRKSNTLNLPHENTIRKLSTSFDINPAKEQIDDNFLHYIRKKVSLLKDSDKLVILMLDEIHLKQYVDYKGGEIVGMSFNTNVCAASAHVFMIKSVLSKFKDVVHILPVKTLTGEDLHAFIKKIIIGLEKISFNVLCVITDNNSINRKAMSYFCSPPVLQAVYPHPLDNQRPLFFIIDSVHLLKCIRNNWLNQKNDDQCFYYPNFNEGFDASLPHNFKTASLKTIKLLHDQESNALVKFGYKLSFKALAPSHLERQNVNLVLQLFNEFVAQALIELGEKHNLQHYQATADFITLILTWWQIFNVKSSSKGSRLNNMYQMPLTIDDSDPKIIFLNKILDWLEEWEKMKPTTGMFSKETHAALKQTIYGMIEITRYCKDELNIGYILPGKFQTDDLESRFGLYRQLAGSQYNISLQQLFECEKKLRLQSALKLKLQTKAFGEIEIKDFECNSDFINIVSEGDIFDITVEMTDITDSESCVPVIIYLAGYCMYSILKKVKCSSCKDVHLIDKKLDLNINYDFLKNLDRGQLMFPREHVVNAVLYTYIVVNKLCFTFQAEFLRKNNHRHIATETTLSILDDYNMLQSDEFCSNFHSYEYILKRVIWVTVNILLNNFCKKKNEEIILSQQTKKNTNKKSNRKFETLSK